jgi:hypothetical protein
MDKHLIKVFNLESNSNYITALDLFKLYRNFDAYATTLHDYASKNKLTELEEYYYRFETDPRRRFVYNISQTYFDNYFLSIYFILSNPSLISTPNFDSLYREKDLLCDITDHIIHLYRTLDSKSERFFNKKLLEKFIANLDFTPLDEVTRPEYRTYLQLFSQETNRLKLFLIDLVKDPKWATHPEQGLSQYEPEIYQFCFEYHTGLKININDFPKIKQWAQIHLDRLMEEANQTCDRLLTNDDDKKKSVSEKITLLGENPNQCWSSKQEMIDTYNACISKYRQIFIDEYKFKEFNSPGLVILDNPLLTGGYYYKDKFYLNVCNWSNGNQKFEVENLTLHETIPGHHLQLDISYHSPKHCYLTALLYAPCNGFIEGWGLFSEHLGNLMLNDPWVYFGYLQMNILRTFRIIADILLHVEGQTPEQVIQLARQYLTNDASTIAEIYRYRILPGQSCSYKTGLEVFKTILKKKFNVTDVKDFLRSDLLDWYKEVLWNTERPLDLLLRENQITWSFDG